MQVIYFYTDDSRQSREIEKELDRLEVPYRRIREKLPGRAVPAIDTGLSLIEGECNIRTYFLARTK